MQPEIPLSAEIISRTPPEVIDLLVHLLLENQALREENQSLRAHIKALEARIEQLEARLNKNSSNSNKPPSSDPPFTQKPDKQAAPKQRRKRKGVRQQCLRPDEVLELHPGPCSCGCEHFVDLEPYYVHQTIELAQIKTIVRHFGLHRGNCAACGKVVKAHIPHEWRSGFGPRLCAAIIEIVGINGDSRRTVQECLFSLFGIPISQGAIQKVVERGKCALIPHYEAIRDEARHAPVNHVDETSWRRRGKLEWLWLLGNSLVAFFMLHGHRSAAAFAALIGDWQGLLVSDGYGVYRKWVHGRQTCLAHLIREAKGLSESKDKNTARCGAWAKEELRRLCRMAKTPPSRHEWNMFYARFLRLIFMYSDAPGDAGKFSARLLRELEYLWTFLNAEGVSPTNNHAERLLRFAVLWRKRSFGTKTEQGNRFVERILSLRHTCRLRGKRTFQVLVDAFEALFQNRQPDLAWIQTSRGDTP